MTTGLSVMSRLVDVPMGPSSDLHRMEYRMSRDGLDRPACDHMKSSRSNWDSILESSCFDLPILGKKWYERIPKKTERK